MKGKKLALISKIALFILMGVATVIVWRNGSGWLEEIDKYNWNINTEEIILSALLLAVSLSLTPSGWVLICHSMGSQIPSREMFAAWYASQLGRYIPGKIWLFAGRAGFLKARGMKTGRAAATTVYELFFTVASIGLLVVILAVINPEVFQHSGGRTAALAAASAVLLLPLLHPVQSFFCRKKGIDPEQLPSIKTSVAVTLIYSFLWFLRGLSLYLLLEGTGLANLKFSHSLAAAPLSWLAGYIVFFVPGGIGVREAAAAAIAAPALVAPAAVIIAGQRLFMALMEVLLALLNTGKLKLTPEQEGSTDVPEE
ncbi:MAG: flippase-like domain-containing protein [Candidatus Sabulitectum sp.]|nr:flippase-like domain-containing protein [Candidatus Sabulitectum sp.]